MKTFRSCSIQIKLTLIVLIITLLVLLLFSGFFVYNDLQNFKTEQLKNLAFLAVAVGATSAASLQRGDVSSADQVLKALAEEKQIAAAALYDKTNNLFVTYQTDPAISFPAPSTLKPGHYIKSNHLEILEPIEFEGKTVGTLYLHGQLGSLRNRLHSNFLMMGLIVSVALALAFALARKLQRVITGPILALANTAREISNTSDYSIRVRSDCEDELGTLYKGFNEMLAKIEKREAELEENRDHLEELVTECRITGEARKESEEMTRTVLNNAFDAIITMDDKGVVTSWNQRAAAIFGWAANEITGKTLVDTIIPPRYREAHFQGLQRYIKTGRGQVLNQQLELSALHRDGHEIPIEIAISATQWGGCYIFTGIIRDITERKKAEKQIEQRKRELIEYRNHLEEQVDKKTGELKKALNKSRELNDLKNRFLGIASHDLRNPVFLIRTYSHVLKEGSLGALSNKQEKLLKKIYDSSEYMRALLDNLLDISKIESGKIELNLEHNNINAVIAGQVEIHQLMANKKKIHLKLVLGDVPDFKFDKNAVSQVIDNYLGNAVKFSKPKTQICVATENFGDRIRFSVRDQGPGISGKDQSLLFGEFQTLSAKPTGGEKSTGLGLAIAKKIVNLHGGEVGVFSEPGQGSTFYFTLPRK